MDALNFLWLELTSRCQLSCSHCYAESGPGGDDGVMTFDDWSRIIVESAGLGATMVQFIGGEPTLHGRLPDLVGRALDSGLRVEIFSNLVHVPERMWQVFERPGVRLATSYYADNAPQHERITMRGGSHARTRANIIEAVQRSIPLRVGVIDVEAGQRVEEARTELIGLGVSGDIRVDHLRQVGRGGREHEAGMDQLYGHCARGKIAISPSGDVWPCVFSRWLVVGNVRRSALSCILTGERMKEVSTALSEGFDSRPTTDDPCDPACGPNCSPACNPSCWPTGTGPCGPNGGCQPNYD